MFSLFYLFDQSNILQSVTQIQCHENLHRKGRHTEGLVQLYVESIAQAKSAFEVLKDSW